MKNNTKQLSEFIIVVVNMYRKLGIFSNEELVRAAEISSNIPGMRLFKKKYRCGYGEYKIPEFSHVSNASNYLQGIFLRFPVDSKSIV